jgi:hypothetical protein
MILAALVDGDALLKVILYAFLGGVGVTVVFSFGIVGLTRYEETRHGTRGGSGVGYALLAALSTVIVLAVVVEAIVVMTQK